MPGCSSMPSASREQPDRLLRGDGRDGGRVGYLLRAAIAVEHAGLVHARQRAGWGAGLLGMELADYVVAAIIEQWNAWIAALLRAPMHPAVLGDVEIAGAGAAFPVVGLAVHQVALEQPV